MKRMRVIILLLLFKSISIAQTGSEKPFIRFKNLSDDINSVLSQEKNARCFFHDSHGFIWIGDLDGFKCYDGYSFKEYKLKVVLPKTKEKPNEDMMVTAITEDHFGNIWAFASFDKMYHLDRKTDVVTIYKLGNPGIGRFTSSRDFTRCMFEDSKKRLWVSTDDGFKRFDRETKKFIAVPYDPKTHTGWLFEGKEGKLWEVLTEGVKCTDSETNIFIPFQNKKGEKQKIEDAITRVIEDKSGNFWISTIFQGLFHFDKNTKLLTQYKNEPQNTNSIASNTVLDILEDYYGRIWIANDNGGLVIFDPTTIRFHRYQTDLYDRDAITSTPFALFKDKNHGIWIIHFLKGISYVGLSTKKFKNYEEHSGDPTGLNDSYIGYFFERPDGNIWLATNHEGLNLWNRKHNTFEHFKHDPDNPNSLSSNLINQVIEDKAGIIWVVVTPNGNIDRFDYKKKQFKHYSIQGDISLDKAGELWLTNSLGLHKYNRKTESFELTLPDLYNLSIDRKGNYWVGSSQGFCKYDFASKQLTDCIKDNFYFIQYDSKGNFWILLDRQGDTLIKYNSALKIFSDTLVIKNPRDYRGSSMIIDDKDQIWIGTVNGLYKYSPENKKLKRYDEADGLASNYMAHTPFALKTSRRELVFASTKGFTVFHPDSIKENLIVPPVLITGFKIKNQEVPVVGSPKDTLSWKSPLKEHIHFTESITLDYSQNDLSLEFAALSYENPQKNQYKYILEGYDRDWTATDATMRIAKYTNLGPGNYTFRVIGSNNDGVWNDKGDTLVIRILPPWWQTWWAYGNYMLLLAFAGWRVHLDQKKRTIKKERERAQARELAQAKEIEKAYKELKSTQTQLIQKEKMASLGELTAGIAHEIQNPLNFVNNFSELSVDLAKELNEEIDKDAIDKAFVKDLVNDLTSNQEKINHHGKRASNIVKGMLEHSRTSTGVKEPTDINKLVDEYLRLSYHGMRAKDKSFNADYTMELDETISKIDIIPQDIGRVLVNLFNNAFYAVHQKSLQGFENYTPSVSVSTKQVGSNIEIKVTDNGNGIPENIRQKIFQPFFTTKPTGEGTGLGLSLSYDIVVKGHGGSLAVESTVQGDSFGEGVGLSAEQAGSEFIIQLPITE